MTTQPAPTCRDWPAGTRVRCVWPTSDGRITEGAEYTIEQITHDGIVYVRETWGGFMCTRFKPVVRVPMGRGPHILPNYTIGPSC